MQVTVEDLGQLKRKMKIIVPGETVQSACDELLQDTAKRVDIQGFRKGHVPIEMVRERYGESVRYNALDKVIRDVLPKAFEQEKLEPVAQPNMTSMNADPGKDAEFELEFEIFPSVELKDLAGVTIEKSVSEVADADIDKAIEGLQKQSKTWNKVDRAAQNGDRVRIDFEVLRDGKPIDQGTAKDFPLELGANTMIPGFEEPLLNTTAGQDVEFDLSFPENYHAKDLAGQPAHFKIKVHAVEEGGLPELNEEFVKRYGAEDGKVETLREKIRSHLQLELDGALKVQNKNKVFDELMNIHDIHLPQTMVDNEMHRMYHQQHDHGKKQEQCHGHELSEDDKKALEPEAKRRVKLGLILRAAVEKYGIKPNMERVNQLVRNMASNYADPEAYVSWYLSDQNRQTEMGVVDVEDQLVEKMLETATINEKKLTSQEALSR